MIKSGLHNRDIIDMRPARDQKPQFQFAINIYVQNDPELLLFFICKLFDLLINF